MRNFHHFPSFYPTLLQKSEILESESQLLSHGIMDCTIQLSVNPMHCSERNVQTVTLYLCTGFQSMHVANIWQASSNSIPTYNMDRGGMVSHGLVTQCDPHQTWREAKELGKAENPFFYKQLLLENFFFPFFLLFLRTFLFPRDLNFRNFSLKDPNLP